MAKPGRGNGWDLILLLLLSLFFNPSVTTCHLPYILLRKTQGERVIPSVCCCYSRCFQLLCFINPLALQALPLYFCCAKHPAMLRDTARGECDTRFVAADVFFNPSVFSTPPSFGHLPYICCAKHRGGVWYMSFFTVRCVFYDNNIKHSHLLYCCVTRQRRRCIFLSLLLRFYTWYPVMLRDTAGRRGRSIEC